MTVSHGAHCTNTTAVTAITDPTPLPPRIGSLGQIEPGNWTTGPVATPKHPTTHGSERHSETRALGKRPTCRTYFPLRAAPARGGTKEKAKKEDEGRKQEGPGSQQAFPETSQITRLKWSGRSREKRERGIGDPAFPSSWQEAPAKAARREGKRKKGPIATAQRIRQKRADRLLVSGSCSGKRADRRPISYRRKRGSELCCAIAVLSTPPIPPPPAGPLVRSSGSRAGRLLNPPVTIN